MIKQLLKIFNNYFNTKHKLIEYKDPIELEKLLEGDLDLDKIIKYSVKTHHPFFLNQLYTGTDSYGVLAETITALLNTSAYTYEVSPVFTILEKKLFKIFLDLFGFSDGDAIFAPGGSISNLYALHLARFKYGNAKIYCSKQAHYSIIKSANLTNMKVEFIDCDEFGRIDVQQLSDKIKIYILNNK